MVPSTSFNGEVKLNSIMQGRSSSGSSMLKFIKLDKKFKLEIGHSSKVGANQRVRSFICSNVRIDRLESIRVESKTFESMRLEARKVDSMQL